MSTALLPDNADLSGRCFSCGAPERVAVRAGFFIHCTWCDIRVRQELFRKPDMARAWLDQVLQPNINVRDDSLLRLDEPTLRSLALRADLAFIPRKRPIRFEPLAYDERSVGITRVILARVDDPRLAGALGRDNDFFSKTIVILDTGTVPPAFHTTWPDTRFIARSLAGDFAAQRNVAQAALHTDWALHLDTDETLPPRTLTRLHATAALAARHRLRAVGIARRNYVDGLLSALFPDTQYRLVHRHVRFEGQVHERPEIGRAHV